MGPATLRLDRADLALVLVDAQARAVADMPSMASERALRSWIMLLEVAARFQLPVAACELDPNEGGPLVPVIKEALNRVTPPPRIFAKARFSCAGEPLFEQFLGHGRRTLVVCGLETHVSVYQTVRDLLARGYRVHVPLDGVLARRAHDRRVGLELIRETGAIVTTAETVLFDLIGTTASDEYRALARHLR